MKLGDDPLLVPGSDGRQHVDQHAGAIGDRFEHNVPIAALIGILKDAVNSIAAVGGVHAGHYYDAFCLSRRHLALPGRSSCVAIDLRCVTRKTSVRLRHHYHVSIPSNKRVSQIVAQIA
jgi:hypothetical protein